MTKKESKPASPSQLHVFYHYTYGTFPVKIGKNKGISNWRTGQRRPVWTHCFVTDGAGRHAKGNALCSPNDNPCKATGRKIAYKRALRGYYEQANILGQAPNGSTMYKTMVGPPTALEQKFLDMAKKSVDPVVAAGA